MNPSFRALSNPENRFSFKKSDHLGSGHSCTVYRGYDNVTHRQVAMKKLFSAGTNDVQKEMLREVKILREISHPNIITLIEVYQTKGSVIEVLEHCAGDLDSIISNYRRGLPPGYAKCLMYMLLSGVKCISDYGIVHRDIKPKNLLIGYDHTLKVTDFGQAKCLYRGLTEHTLCSFAGPYSAPEMAVTSGYGLPADMWSVGCVFAEIISGEQLFKKEALLPRLLEIRNLIGPPEKEWSDSSSIYQTLNLQTEEPPTFDIKFPVQKYGVEAVDLLKRLLLWNPNARITATEALRHPYFFTEPFAVEKDQVPLPRALTDSRRVNFCDLEQDDPSADMEMGRLITPWQQRRDRMEFSSGAAAEYGDSEMGFGEYFPSFALTTDESETRQLSPIYERSSMKSRMDSPDSPRQRSFSMTSGEFSPGSYSAEDLSQLMAGTNGMDCSQRCTQLGIDDF